MKFLWGDIDRENPQYVDDVFNRRNVTPDDETFAKDDAIS
jgi:hypothetical protein